MLLTCMTGRSDYIHLLLSAGWFILSTALKGVAGKIQRRVLKGLPRSASVLIEDVLKGVVNPNILHDEMQIHKAQQTCVRLILQLFDEGIINLER